MSRRVDVTPDDGTTLGLSVFDAAAHDGGNLPGALVLPAMGVRAAYYERFAQALAACGVPAVTADWRGHGSSRPHVSRRSRFGYAELVERDIPSVVRAVRAEFGGRPVSLIGHSLGAQLSAVALGAARAEAHSLVVLAAGSAYHALYAAPMSRRLRWAARMSPVVTALVGYWPGERMGFAGRESRGVMRDWSRQVLTGRYVFGGRDYTPSMASVRIPVLAITIEGDDYAPTTGPAFFDPARPGRAVDLHRCGRRATDRSLPLGQGERATRQADRNLARQVSVGDGVHSGGEPFPYEEGKRRT